MMKFLLTSKKCWLLEEELIPMYQHLVDDYSINLREDWNVKVEETDVEVVQQVKEEPQDDNLVEPQDDSLVEPQSLQVNSNTTNVFKVILSHCKSRYWGIN